MSLGGDAEGDAETALKLQQPLPASRLAVVATGQKQDAAAADRGGPRKNAVRWSS
jgi:hypothetical protein